MCTRLVLTFGKERTLDLLTSDAPYAWADYRAALASKEGNQRMVQKWEGVKAFPFGGYRRLDNLEKNMAREAVWVRDNKGRFVLDENGNRKPIYFRVPIVGFTEGIGDSAVSFICQADAEFRLHTATVFEKGKPTKAKVTGWFLLTTDGSKIEGMPKDNRGNRRAPKLTNVVRAPERPSAALQMELPF